MAFLGVQLVVTMVMVSLLQKLSAHYSLGRWLLCYRLVRYLHPSDEELKSLAGIQQSTGKGKGRKGRDRKGDQEEEENTKFLVPRSLQVQLDTAVVQPIDMIQLRYYAEFQWLMDFAACAVVVYSITELYLFLMPAKSEVNLSVVWCVLVIGLSLKLLVSLTALYFRGEEAIGERSLCLTAGFFFFLISMIVLIADENILEFGLETAYSSFNESAHGFLQNQGLHSSGPASQLMFKFSLALWCGLMGTFFTFPGFRFARMHRDTLKYCDESAFLKLILHLSFLSPFFIILLWVKPLSRDYFTQRVWPGMTSPLMRSDVFETTRLVLVVAAVMLRLVLMPRYLQSYLNMAPERMEQLRKEAGRISNIELQKMVARVFYYLCVVALQYVVPMLLCLFTTFLLKTLGDYTWSSYILNTVTTETQATVSPESSNRNPLLSNESDSIYDTSQQFSLALANLRKVFTPLLYRGVLGFMTWWLCAVWFFTSTVGLVYHSYWT